MRICYVSHALFVHDYRFLYKLVERGYETYLVAYRNGDIPEEITKIKGLNIIHYRPKNIKKIQKFLFAFKLPHFQKVLKQIKPDVVHSGVVWQNGFLVALSGFHPHLLMPWDGEVIGVSKYPIFRQIVKYTLRNADMITCDCETVKKAAVKLAGISSDKIVVFPWGLELDRFNPAIDGMQIRKKLGWENKKILIMNRHFRPIYGHPFFINALPAVIRMNPDVRIILIGEGMLKEDIHKQIKKLGIEDYINLAGWVPLMQMPHYLNASDIYVSSSLMDGTSMSLLEAMACGLPVVVTDVPAVLEWVVDGVNGYIAERQNSDMLAEKINRLLGDDYIRRKMKEENLRIVMERADWNKNFSKLEKMYEDLVKK